MKIIVFRFEFDSSLFTNDPPEYKSTLVEASYQASMV